MVSGFAAAAFGFQAAAARAGRIPSGFGYVTVSIEISPVGINLLEVTGFVQLHDLAVFAESGDKLDCVCC